MTANTVNKAQLIDEYLKASDAGDKDGAMKIARRIPLHPSIAKSVLDAIGKESLVENFELSEATASFGEGWMDE